MAENSFLQYTSDKGIAMGWTRFNWADNIGRAIAFAGQSHDPLGDNSVRAFAAYDIGGTRPGKWTTLYPNNNGTGGVQNRDNHCQFYVPSRKELWVLKSSVAQFGGRFDCVNNVWANVSQTAAEFSSGLIQNFPSGFITEDSAHDWSANLDTGVSFGGQVQGNPSSVLHLIEPNVEGPEPYQYTLLTTGPTWPAPRGQVENQGVCIGDDFYVYSGENADASARNDLWRFHIPTRTWVSLAPNLLGGSTTRGAYGLIVYDPAQNVILTFRTLTTTHEVRVNVYQIDTNDWVDASPPQDTSKTYRVGNI